MNKKGQIQLSFGMIFSVIIIAITLFVAGYVIMSFLKTSNCAKLGNFDKALGSEIDLVYQNLGETNKKITTLPAIPSKVSWVCFGSLNQNADGADKEKRDYFISNNLKKSDNLFFYPIQQSCERKYASFNLEHVTTPNFFCLPVKSDKVEPRITKNDSTNLLVRLSK
jgi:hypothetical protein